MHTDLHTKEPVMYSKRALKHFVQVLQKKR